MNIAFASYGIYPLFYVTVFLMSVAILMLAKSIDNSITSTYGRYTLPIYAFHLLIMGVITLAFNKVGLTIGIKDVYGILISLLTLFVTTICIIPLKKYVPNLIGSFK